MCGARAYFGSRVRYSTPSPSPSSHLPPPLSLYYLHIYPVCMCQASIRRQFSLPRSALFVCCGGGRARALSCTISTVARSPFQTLEGCGAYVCGCVWVYVVCCGYVCGACSAWGVWWVVCVVCVVCVSGPHRPRAHPRARTHPPTHAATTPTPCVPYCMYTHVYACTCSSSCISPHPHMCPTPRPSCPTKRPRDANLSF